jgi:hypothetical protein
MKHPALLYFDKTYRNRYQGLLEIRARLEAYRPESW